MAAKSTERSAEAARRGGLGGRAARVAAAAAVVLAVAACNQHSGRVNGPGGALSAQYAGLGHAPPNARPDACYKKVLRPAQTRTVSDRVLVQPAGQRQEIIPARYETITEQVLVQEAGERVVEVPPTFRTETREEVIQPAVERVRVIPAQFRTIRETVWVAPDGSHHQEPQRVRTTRNRRVQVSGPRQVRKHFTDVRADDRVISTDGEFRVVVEPAQYGTRAVAGTGIAPGWRRETITRRELIRPEETETYVEPAVTRRVRAQVIDQPARTEVVPVPARFETRTRRVEIQPEQRRTVQVAAQYDTVTREEVIAPQQVVWAEVLCEGASNEAVIRAAQRALFEEGYYTGAIDGVYNVNFDVAVEAFQRDEQLATGGLTIDTLRALGVSV